MPRLPPQSQAGRQRLPGILLETSEESELEWRQAGAGVSGSPSEGGGMRSWKAVELRMDG